MAGFLKMLFGDTSQREIKKIRPIVKAIEALAAYLKTMK